MLLSPGVQALEVKDLYRAEVPVKTQEFQERKQVYPAAISQVIVKLSGDRMAPELPQLAELVANGRLLVQQFYYEKLPEEGYLALKEEGYTRLLVVRFDGEAVTKALVDAGVALWGRSRPEVLLWLAVEDREARYLLATNASLELESYLGDYSRRRGMPIMLPLMDLEDQMKLNFADIWGDFRQPILEASQRYGVDAVLVGRLFRSFDGEWQARWSLYQGSEAPEYWQGSGLNQDVVLGGGIEGVADRLARRYAQVLGQEASDDVVVLKVKDVKGLAGYARAMKYLESLDSVGHVQVAKVHTDEVLFELDVRGDAAGLERAISLGSILRPVVTAQQESEENKKTFVYQLLP